MADRYWVGGTNTWNTTAGTKWATTSGGAGGASVPGTLDDVFFDAASGAVTVTWAAGASATVRSINCTGFTGTLATGGNSKTLNGTGTVWTSPSTCTITGAPTMTVSSTGATAISVTCNHASPSTTNAPIFQFSGGTYALTINGTGFRGLSWTPSGGAQTISGTVSVYGGVTTNHVKNFTGLNITFLATATFRFNDANSTISEFPILGDITINAPGGAVSLQDNTFPSPFTLGTTKTLTLTAGTFSVNGRPVSTGRFSSSGTSTRVYSTASGSPRVQTIELTSTTAGATVLDMANATGFSYTISPGPGRPIFVRNQAATATMVFGTTGGTTSNACNLTVNGGASALTLTSGSYFGTTNFTGSTCTVTAASLNLAGSLTLASGGTYTSVVPTFRGNAIITSNGKTLGTTTVNGSGITVTLADAATVSVIAQNFTLTQGTINLAGFTLTAPRFSSSGSNTRAINFGSGGGITLTSNDIDLFRMDTATNFTWSGTGGITLTGGGGNGRFDFGTLGGATASNVLDLTITTAAGLVVQFASGSSVRSINCPSGNPSLQTISGTTNLYGNLTLIAGVGSSYAPFKPVFRASATITSAGKSLGDVAVNGAGITVTLADAFVSNNALTLTEGTFANPSNFNVTAFNFLSNSGNACSLSLGSSTWTITGGGATTSWVATNASLTFNAGTSTISLTYVGVKEFFAGNRTYYNVNVGGTGDFYIYGTNTFNNITNSVQPATVIFESGLTQTVSNFGLSGTAGNLITISSEAAGFDFTLSKASGTVNAQYLSIQDSIATGGAVWNAFTSNGNVDAGNNTGWIFSAAGGNMFLMFI